MKKPNYPSEGFIHTLKSIMKSEWQEFARTFFITAAVIVATLVATDPKLSTIAPHSWQILAAFAGCYFFASVVSIYKSALTKKYDPTLALKYTDVFFVDIKEEKRLATGTLLVFHSTTSDWANFKDRSDIDPVLDVLDDLGFLLQGEQISNWVLYQYFSYWIQLYYEASKGYIQLRQQEDPTLWEHLSDLYDEMMRIQAHKTKKPVTDLLFGDDLVELLEDELLPVV